MDNDMVSKIKTSEQMTSPRNEEPTYQSDEIDLVDLWISFWGRRNLFLLSAILAIVLGIVLFETMYTPKREATVRSIIETQGIRVGHNAVASEYSDALARRISIADLPRFASVDEFSHIKPILVSSAVTAIKQTNFIEIVTIVPPSEVEQVSKFHNRLTEQIVSDIKIPPRSVLKQTRDQLSSIQVGVTRLRSLVHDLEGELQHDVHLNASPNQTPENKSTLNLDEVGAEIYLLSEDIISMMMNFWRLNPRVLIAAEVSEKTAGVKKPMAYSVIIVLGIFLGIFVVIANGFVARVKERMASRS